MKIMNVLKTKRLTLRRWLAADREPFGRMNCDPAVMRFMPALLSTEESDRLVDRIEAHCEEHGFGLWAAELRDTARFVGFIGLAVPRFQAEFMPAVEIGWRLDKEVWGQGLATEGAREVVRHAFEDLQLDALVSFTVPANLASRRVMEKLANASATLPSDWIAFDANNCCDNGLGTYTETFDLTGYNLSTVSISGSWTIDDSGILILNGKTIGTLGDGNWGTMFAFSDSTSTDFNQGLNTLQIEITGTDVYLEGVNLSGTLTGQQNAPEPSYSAISAVCGRDPASTRTA